jgi:polyhydroxyalkanoate synthesis regulator phasin
LEEKQARLDEQRAMVLRDTIADLGAAEREKRNTEITNLKKHVADLEQKLKQQATIEERVCEISTRLEEKQARLDEYRAVVLRDAIADLGAAEREKHDTEIANLKKHVADLEQELKQQATIVERVCEISARLKEKQARLDEQQVVDLRGAIANFVAPELEKRDGEISSLKKTVADLEQKLKQQSAIDERVHEIAARLEEKQIRRDEAKRGPRGPKGEPGRRGEPGQRGERGPPGKDAKPAKIHWHIDAARYRVTPIVDGCWVSWTCGHCSRNSTARPRDGLCTLYLARVFSPLMRAEGQYRPGPWHLPFSGGWLPAGTPWNFWQLGKDPIDYSPSAIVERCIAAYSETIASLSPAVHWHQNDMGGRTRVDNSALARVMRRPNSYETASSFLLNLIRCLYLEGNAYALALRNNRFEIDELHLMNPRQSFPQVAETGDVFFRLSGNAVIDRMLAGGQLIVPERDVLHIKLHESRRHPWPLVGETPLHAAMADIAVGDAFVNRCSFLRIKRGPLPC